VAALLEVPTQLGHVVELAVVDQHGSAVERDHRLVAAVRQVDHGEAAIRKRNRPVDPLSLVVGASVGERVAHPARDRRVDRTTP
jgi:hypothetical protein